MVAQTQQLNDGFSNTGYLASAKDITTTGNVKATGRERAASKISAGSEIVEVYMDNFYKELQRIEILAQEYNFIAMVSIGSVFKKLRYRTRSFLETSTTAAPK